MEENPTILITHWEIQSPTNREKITEQKRKEEKVREQI